MLAERQIDARARRKAIKIGYGLGDPRGRGIVR
jgi:hypothetical protein